MDSGLSLFPGCFPRNRVYWGSGSWISREVPEAGERWGSRPVSLKSGFEGKPSPSSGFSLRVGQVLAFSSSSLGLLFVSPHLEI